jgi:hypothetical protein
MSSEIRLLLLAAAMRVRFVSSASGDNNRGHRCRDLFVDDGEVFAAN